MFAREAARKKKGRRGGGLTIPSLSALHKVTTGNCCTTVPAGKASSAITGRSKTGPNRVMPEPRSQ
jgi:hypothetical protein